MRLQFITSLCLLKILHKKKKNSASNSDPQKSTNSQVRFLDYITCQVLAKDKWENIFKTTIADKYGG